MSFRKGAAQTIQIVCYDAETPTDPTDPVAKLSKQGAGFAVADDSPPFVVGNGLVTVLLTEDEADCDYGAVKIESSNLEDQVTLFYTEAQWTTMAALASVVWDGQGAKVCTMTVKDGDANPVGNCPFLLKNAGGQVLLVCNTNTGTGQVVVNLDQADDYEVTLGPLFGYSFSNPYDADVGAAAAQAFTLTCAKHSAPTPPVDPEVCAVHGFFRGHDKVVLQGTFEVIDLHSPRVIGEAPASISLVCRENPTDIVDGVGQLEVVKGCLVDIKATLTGAPDVIRRKCLVPDASSVDWTTLGTLHDQ